MSNKPTIPDDIREALKIREGLDGISGTCNGQVVLHHRQSRATSFALFIASTLGFLMCLTALYASLNPLFMAACFLLFQLVLWTGYRAALVFGVWTGPLHANVCMVVMCFSGIGVFAVSGLALYDYFRNFHSFTLEPARFALGPTQFAYSDVQRVSTFRNDSGVKPRPFGVQIDLYGKRTPHTVMVSHNQKTTEWLVEQILSRCENAQSGSVPEDLTRLTNLGRETEASTGPVRRAERSPITDAS